MYFKFSDEVHFYTKFVKDNLFLFGNLILLKEQLNIDNKYFIDILAFDIDKQQIVIIELKNLKKKIKIIDQIVTYYDLIKQSNIDELIEDYIINNDLKIIKDNINYEPIIYIVLPDFDNQLISNLNYLNNINVEIYKLNAEQKNDYFELIKEKYVPQNIDKNIIINDKLENKEGLDKYFLSNEKLKLIKAFINYMIYNYNCNVFYLKNYISIYNKKSLIIKILVNMKTNLQIEIKNNYNNLIYNDEIINYKILDNAIKIDVKRIPVNLINNIMKGK